MMRMPDGHGGIELSRFHASWLPKKRNMNVIVGLVTPSGEQRRLGWAAADSIPACPRGLTCQRCRRRLPETAERDLIGAWLLPR